MDDHPSNKFLKHHNHAAQREARIGFGNVVIAHRE